jgi:hypothetical protein
MEVGEDQGQVDAATVKGSRLDAHDNPMECGNTMPRGFPY